MGKASDDDCILVEVTTQCFSQLECITKFSVHKRYWIFSSYLTNCTYMYYASILLIVFIPQLAIIIFLRAN